MCVAPNGAKKDLLMLSNYKHVTRRVATIDHFSVMGEDSTTHTNELMITDC